jgi:trigger factor
MDMSLDNVPVDGGTARDYQVYLSEEHYIPGFNKELHGLKAGDEKKFSLSFPDSHYQKMLAGKKVDFAVKVKQVLDRKLPELSDELAKKLGQESVEKLQTLIRTNIIEEEKRKAEERLEIDLFKKLIEASSFDTIPEIIINAEKQKMFYELKRDLDRSGITIEQYLSDIKKNEQDLFRDFSDQALDRAKAALVSRQVAKENNLSATPEEINEEIKIMRDMYKDNKEYMDRLDKPEVKDTIATMIQNRKVLAWLKDKIVEKATT